MNVEMRLLREGLTKAGIKWRDDSSTVCGAVIYRTKFKNNQGIDCSVIYGKHISYGWEQGLLESMPPIHWDSDGDFYEVEGYLEARDILDSWV